MNEQDGIGSVHRLVPHMDNVSGIRVDAGIDKAEGYARTSNTNGTQLTQDMDVGTHSTTVSVNTAVSSDAAGMPDTTSLAYTAGAADSNEACILYDAAGILGTSYTTAHGSPVKTEPSKLSDLPIPFRKHDTVSEAFGLSEISNSREVSVVSDTVRIDIPEPHTAVASGVPECIHESDIVVETMTSDTTRNIPRCENAAETSIILGASDLAKACPVSRTVVPTIADETAWRDKNNAVSGLAKTHRTFGRSKKAGKSKKAGSSAASKSHKKASGTIGKPKPGPSGVTFTSETPGTSGAVGISRNSGISVISGSSVGPGLSGAPGPSGTNSTGAATSQGSGNDQNRSHGAEASPKKPNIDGSASSQSQDPSGEDVPHHAYYMSVDPMSLPPPDDATLTAACSSRPSRKKRRRYAAPLEPVPPPGFHQPFTLQPLAYGYPMPAIAQSLPEKKPKTYMLFNGMVTLFCCLFFGLMGMLRSRQCTKAVEAGELEKAVQHSAKAKRWGVLAVVFGVLLNTGIILALYFKFHYPATADKGD